MYKYLLFFLTVLYGLAFQSAWAETWTLPPEHIDVFGQIRTVQAGRRDTLLDIARAYDIGQTEIVLANPNVDRWMPENGSEVILPNRHIFPQVARKGIVLNLPEMRLYYFPKPKKNEKPIVMTFPIGIGKMDWETPLGLSKITQKKKDPIWYPPESIKKHKIESGEPPLPDAVPPGPDNPLGRYSMRLGIGSGSYLIHGTIKPFGVGMRVSSGCIRLYPEDIENLFDKVPVGTQVHIINKPIKLGWLLDELYIELHPPLEEDEAKYTDYSLTVYDAIASFMEEKSNIEKQSAGFELNHEALKKAVQEKKGIPVLISRTIN